MSDPILFWTIVGAVGQGIGALATAAAVITSLWVVISERKPNLRVSAGLRLSIIGDGSPATDVIGIQIANQGQRRVTCTAIGWRTGYLRRGPEFLKYRMALQNPAYEHGSVQLPFDLEPGEEKFLAQNVEAYRLTVANGAGREFFCRQLPWKRAPSPTKIEICISLSAHNGIFQRVEPAFAHFLSTGLIEKGAARFNRASEGIHDA